MDVEIKEAREIIKRITQVTVLPKGQPIFCEEALHIRIEDEAAGEFVVIESTSEHWGGKIAIDEGDWPTVRKAIDDMMETLHV